MNTISRQIVFRLKTARLESIQNMCLRRWPGKAPFPNVFSGALLLLFSPSFLSFFLSFFLSISLPIRSAFGVIYTYVELNKWTQPASQPASSSFLHTLRKCKRFQDERCKKNSHNWSVLNTGLFSKKSKPEESWLKKERSSSSPAS